MSTPDRRQFLTSAGGGGLGASLGPTDLARILSPARATPRSMLILGGTGFLGPAVVESAVARGHRVTLFNRGRTNPELFPELEKLQGDRNEDLSALDGRRWDFVVDTSGYFPKQVTRTASKLADATEHYIFVSTLSVFPSGSARYDEDSAVDTIDAAELASAEASGRITGQNYGPLKARCEAAAEAAMPGRVANVRPGLIVGPRDNSDRFTYWPVRIARGGEVLAPNARDNLVQFVDVRDLGEWIVRLGEARTTGVYNAVGFDGPITLADILHGCKIVLDADCSFAWVDEDFLQREGVRPWTGPDSLPLWIPGARGEFVNDKARAAGLTFRPIADTIRDTLAWFGSDPKRELTRSGIAIDKELAVLKAWHARAK